MYLINQFLVGQMEISNVFFVSEFVVVVFLIDIIYTYLFFFIEKGLASSPHDEIQKGLMCEWKNRFLVIDCGLCAAAAEPKVNIDCARGRVPRPKRPITRNTKNDIHPIARMCGYL